MKSSKIRHLQSLSLKKIANIFDNIHGETQTLTTKISEVEPYAQGINTKVAELEHNIREKISLLVSKTEEHRIMIEQSATSLFGFSEKIVSYEKDQEKITEHMTKSSEKEFDAFKQEIDSKVSKIITNKEYQ